MNRSAIPVLLFLIGLFGAAGSALADDPTPSPTPGNGRHNPAFEACKKQADDQKLPRGDQRRDFIKNCMKSAPPSS